MSLAGGVYVVYYIATNVFFVLFTTNLRTPSNYKVDSSFVKAVDETFYHKINNTKPAVQNFVGFSQGVNTLMLCLIIEMSIVQSFHMAVGDACLIGIGLFFILGGISVIFYELVVVKYQIYQYGYYLGIFVGSLLVGLPLVHYEHKFVGTAGEKLKKTTVALLSILNVVVGLMLLIRTWRIFRYKKQHHYSSVVAPATLRNEENTDDEDYEDDIEMFDREEVIYDEPLSSSPANFSFPPLPPPPPPPQFQPAVYRESVRSNSPRRSSRRR